MRAMRVTVGTAMLLLVLAACGQAADLSAGSGSAPPSGSSSTPTGSSTEPSTEPSPPPPTKAPPTGTAVPPQGGTALPKSQVDTSALPTHYLDRSVWALDGGRTLVVYGMARTGCSGVSARVVEQNADLVRIVISPMDTTQGGPPDGGMCAQVITPRPVTVGLTDPIGTRKVIVSEGP